MELTRTMKKESMFFPEVLDGKIQLEDEARNVMPYNWKLTESGILAPV